MNLKETLKLQSQKHTAYFRFFGALNDFLPLQKRGKLFRYTYKGEPAIKDTLEAIGVVHTEVDCIFAGKKPLGFYEKIQPHDKVCAYPARWPLKNKKLKHLSPAPLRTFKFIVDSHLGKLARHLRLLGFDALYKTNYPDEKIVKDHLKTGAVILTRDKGLLKNRVVRRGYWVRAIDSKKQIKEVIKEFGLTLKIRPFRLCLECNGKIARIPKSRISRCLPPMVREYYKRFYICRHCRKIYWQGSHYDWLSGFVKELRRP